MSYALITGASSGIGRAYALLLASEGYDLLLTGRRQEKLQSLKKEIENRFELKVDCLFGDLGDSKFLDTLIQNAQPQEIDFLLNNAGFGEAGTFLESAFELQVNMMKVHVEVPMRLCHALAPGMVKRGRGFIVNVTSLAADLPAPKNSVYCASKAALLRFSESLALELRPNGIKVQALMPGFTFSDFHDRLENFSLARQNKGLVRWQSAETVVQSSFRGLGSSQIRWIPGFYNKVLSFIARVLPRKIYYFLAQNLKV